MRKVLLDQGLAPRAAKLLRAEGWDALHVGEAGLDRADDSDILEFARQRGMACVTLDHDFHTHLALALSAALVAAEDDSVLVVTKGRSLSSRPCGRPAGKPSARVRQCPPTVWPCVSADSRSVEV